MSALVFVNLQLLAMDCFTLFHSLCGGVRLCGSDRCLYRPNGKRNVVTNDDSSSSGIWNCPSARSSVAKHVAMFGIG